MEQAAYYYFFWGKVAYCFIIFVLFVVFNFKKSGGDDVVYDVIRLPPGPGKLPVIGSLHHLLGKTLPHRAMANLARRLDAPLMYLKLGEIPVVVASSPEAAREIMQTRDIYHFSKRPFSFAFTPYPDMLFCEINIMALLSGRRVRSFRDVREEEVARLVAAIAATPPGQAVNMSERIAVQVAGSAVRTLIGDRFNRRDEFMVLLEEWRKLASRLILCDLFPSSRFVTFISGARHAVAIHKKNFKLMESTVEQRGRRGYNLLDVLLRIRDETSMFTSLTKEMIMSAIIELLRVGSETSATTLQWAMSELMRNPNVMKRAQKELRSNLKGKAKVTEDDLGQMTYLKLIIKETLRMHPAAPLLLPRESREWCKILGYDIPEGAKVLVNAWAIARDPKYWEDPEQFKPERFKSRTIDFQGLDFEYIPYGAGRRMCPAIALAQANMELVLAALLYHFDWMLIDGLKPSELDMTEEMRFTVRKKNDLYLHPVVRVPPRKEKGGQRFAKGFRLHGRCRLATLEGKKQASVQ